MNSNTPVPLDGLTQIAPNSLRKARNLVHQAVQHLTVAARANLPAAADDSHSNLVWVGGSKMFLSQPFELTDGILQIGFGVEDFHLVLAMDGETCASCILQDKTDAEVTTWLDGELTTRGLAPTADVSLPYDMPTHTQPAFRYDVSSLSNELEALASWFDLANETLSAFADRHQGIDPGPSPVRCWPHHFDIATYVALEAGDFESARGIGVGMSPGDESYDEPYFYVNAWPHPTGEALPTLPSPGHWHTDGFVGAIATATDIVKLDDVPGGLKAFVHGAFTINRSILGA